MILLGAIPVEAHKYDSRSNQAQRRIVEVLNPDSPSRRPAK